MTKKCEYCHNLYETKNKRQKFCSTQCRENNTIDKKKPVEAMKLWLYSRDDFKCIYEGINKQSNQLIKGYCCKKFTPSFVNSISLVFSLIPNIHLSGRDIISVVFINYQIKIL